MGAGWREGEGVWMIGGCKGEGVWVIKGRKGEGVWVIGDARERVCGCWMARGRGCVGDRRTQGLRPMGTAVVACGWAHMPEPIV